MEYMIGCLLWVSTGVLAVYIMDRADEDRVPHDNTKRWINNGIGDTSDRGMRAITVICAIILAPIAILCAAAALVMWSGVKK